MISQKTKYAIKALLALADEVAAGGHALTIEEIAHRLGKRTLPIPEIVLRSALALLKPLRLTQYGPEQTKFLQYRPVLDNARLKSEFGYTPDLTSSDAFDAWLRAHPDAAARTASTD